MIARDGYDSSLQQKTPQNKPNSPGFTIVGIITFGVVLWVVSQNSSGNARSLLNGFLGVLLLSMILLNWEKVKPIFFK